MRVLTFIVDEVILEGDGPEVRENRLRGPMHGADPPRHLEGGKEGEKEGSV